jgi:thiamine-monophosphate kinase
MSDHEFDRIRRLAARFRGPPSPAVGIGDDAAVLPRVDGPLVVTVDASVEHVHFRRGWASLDRLAARAVHAAASDLAAMGADPSRPGGGLLFALDLPSDLHASQFDAIIDGLACGAESLSAPVLGGNLTRSGASALSITTTAMGVADAPLLRSGARAGDNVFVFGTVGGARVGVEALLAGREREPVLAPFVERWLAPRAQIREGLSIAALASACIDLSDGLAQDAAHIAEQSSVGIELEADAILLDHLQVEASRALGFDPIDLALRGGEDYVLLFTARRERVEGATRIGRVVKGRGVHVLRDGVRLRAPSGWDHFT